MLHREDDQVAGILQDVHRVVVGTRSDVLAVHLDYRVAHEQLPRRIRRLVLVDPGREVVVNSVVLLYDG